MRTTKNKVLQTRLSARHKSVIRRAAGLRKVPVSDYVRQVLVSAAERDLRAAENDIIRLSAADQLAFWNALNAPVKLTEAQKRLGRIMRGEE